MPLYQQPVKLADSWPNMHMAASFSWQLSCRWQNMFSDLHKNMCGSKEKPKKIIPTIKKNDTEQQRHLETRRGVVYKAHDNSKVQKDVGFCDSDSDRLGIWQHVSPAVPSCLSEFLLALLCLFHLKWSVNAGSMGMETKSLTWPGLKAHCREKEGAWHARGVRTVARCIS